MRGLGPRVVGGRYWCGYWRCEYTVLAVGVREIVVAWDARPGIGSWTPRVVTHCTPWDARRDMVLA